jgi:hypothetical protein
MKTSDGQPGQNVFAPTELTRKKLRQQRMVGIGFGITTILILIPLVCLVGYLFVKAWPAFPASYMLFLA